MTYLSELSKVKQEIEDVTQEIKVVVDDIRDVKNSLGDPNISNGVKTFFWKELGRLGKREDHLRTRLAKKEDQLRKDKAELRTQLSKKEDRLGNPDELAFEGIVLTISNSLPTTYGILSARFRCKGYD